MNDFSREQPIAPAEIAKAEAELTAKAEAELTPVQRVMSRVIANILTPLDYVELPDDQVGIIRDYSDKAARVAQSEFERLQKESPAQRLIDAFEDERSIMPEEEGQRLVEGAIEHIQSKVREWQDAVAEAQGVAAINREPKTLDQIVADLIGVAGQQVRDGVSQEHRKGIHPTVGILVTDWLEGGGDVKERMATAERAERVLKKLGFLREEATMKALFALPKPSSGKTYTAEEIHPLRWSEKPVEKPVRISEDVVAGLQSESMPGVAAEVEMFGGDRALLSFYFRPEAVTSSVAKIPAVVAT